MTETNAEKIRHWLFELALPFWAAQGKDQVYGGPVEQVGMNGEPSDAGFKRVRVFCRQVYVFSHAHLLGWEAGLAHATDMFEAMVRYAWQGPQFGWAKTVRSDNTILDPTPDLYENAFALFSLGWFYQAKPDPRVLDHMLSTATFIDTRMRHPKSGFWHQLPPTGPRLQNPHMHLLEACLVCFNATQHPIFERLAKEVVSLFCTNFYNQDTQTLCEFFDDDLDPMVGETGLIVEPGHQLEWAWILAEANKIFDLDVRMAAKGLVDFAQRFGVQPGTGATYNAINVDGTGRDLGSRTWPNTERLKAAVAMYELFGHRPEPIVEPTLELLFSRYLASPIPGGWIDAFDATGTPTSTVMPTSTFYHLFLAFAEILRLEKMSR
jgi:mannose/cellobiose epimerase-like protein (N-acyl-D-glucosamine 2-epimerase family)